MAFPLVSRDLIFSCLPPCDTSGRTFFLFFSTTKLLLSSTLLLPFCLPLGPLELRLPLLPYHRFPLPPPLSSFLTSSVIRLLLLFFFIFSPPVPPTRSLFSARSSFLIPLPYPLLYSRSSSFTPSPCFPLPSSLFSPTPF